MTIAVIVIAALTYASYRFGHDSVSSPATETLLVTTRPLPEGTLLTSSDVHAVTIQIPDGRAPLGGLSPQEINLVIGQVANQTLPTGTIVTLSDLEPTGAVPNVSQTLVGLNLKPNQVPQNGLVVGGRVGVIYVPSAEGGKAIPLIDAYVWNISTDQSGNTTCEITVPNKLAAAIAAASDRQQIILVRLSPNAPFPSP